MTEVLIQGLPPLPMLLLRETRWDFVMMDSLFFIGENLPNLAYTLNIKNKSKSQSLAKLHQLYFLAWIHVFKIRYVVLPSILTLITLNPPHRLLTHQQKNNTDQDYMVLKFEIGVEFNPLDLTKFTVVLLIGKTIWVLLSSLQTFLPPN